MFRGLQILLLGYGLRLTFWVLGHFYSPWIRLFKVDILQCIGLSLMVFPLIAWPPNGKGFWRINWSAGLVTLGMAFSTALFFHLPLEGNLPEGIRAYMDVSCRLALFPFFPYGMWIALGLFVGSIVPLELKKGKTEALVVGGLLLAAVFLFFLGKYLDTLTQTYPVYQLWGNKRPPKGLFHGFLIKIAYLMGIFAAARVSALLLDRLPVQFMSLFGRTSLFAYCVHLIIIYHVTYSWMTIPSPPRVHLLYSALLTIFMWGLCWAWRHTSPIAYIKRLLSPRPIAADKVG